jgi:diguanylate cyclase
MDTTRASSAVAAPAAAPNAIPTPAPATATATAIAKGALRRLAQAQLEPTPENYARCYADESGQPLTGAADAKAQAVVWASMVERLAKNLERGGRQWTAARRKSSLHRVLDSSRSDAARLLQRLQALMTAWETDQLEDAVETGLLDEPSAAAVTESATSPSTATTTTTSGEWLPMVTELHHTLGAALAREDSTAKTLAEQLAALADHIAADGATAEHLQTTQTLCDSARRLFGQQHHLVEQLGALCRELTAGLTELSEDDSWAKGQCESVQARLRGGLSVRAVRAAGAVLADTRERQRRVRDERNQARTALKQLIHDMLVEVGDLSEHTGRFQMATASHAQAISSADTLESLTEVVKTLLDDSRAVHSAVSRSQERLQTDQTKATELQAQVRALESELRRLSEEVSTDALTQVANRRGLSKAFEAESSRSERAAAPLAVGLIDIDNFKKLNDTLGHAAGDTALKTLAGEVRKRLRPADHLARFGGEEFVVLLPSTEQAEAQKTLTRLQRSLSEALFLHEGREVFVTFSAGVTAWRLGETLDAALERADSALYEAKRTGKNRTCVA